MAAELRESGAQEAGALEAGARDPGATLADARGPGATEPGAGDGGPGIRAWLAGMGLLGLAVALAWANSLGGEPVFDDHYLVTPASCFRSLDRLVLTFAFLSDHPCAYRPARFWTYGPEYWLSGGAFVAHKVGGVVWHWLAACVAFRLAFLVLQRCGAEARRALLLGGVVALLWALHPVQTDSVTYVSGRRDVLVGLFSMLSLVFALEAERREQAGMWWGAAAGAFVLGVLSKEVAVVVPAIWLAWHLRAQGPLVFVRANPLTAKLGAVGLGLAGLVVLWRGVLRDYSSLDGFWGGTAVAHYSTALMLQARALGVALMQVPLVGDYHPHTIRLAEGPGDPRVWGAALLVAGVIALAFALRRRQPLVWWGIAFWFLAFLPSAQVFPHHELFAEHYLYLPLFGLVLALVVLADATIGRLLEAAPLRRGVAAAVVAVAVLALGLATAERNRVWQDEFTLNRAIVAQAPENVRARYNLGNYLAQEGEDEEALALLYPIMDAWSASPAKDWVTLTTLGQVAGRLGDTDAQREAAEALVTRFGDWPNGHRILAEQAMQARAWTAAEELARVWLAAMETATRQEEAARMLAIALGEQGRLDEALDVMEALDSLHDEQSRGLRCRLAELTNRAATNCP